MTHTKEGFKPQNENVCVKCVKMLTSHLCKNKMTVNLVIKLNIIKW